MRRDLITRLAAIEAWFTAGKRIKLAVQLFKQLVPGHGMTNVARFISLTVVKLLMEGTVLDLKPAGRPKKVPDATVQLLVEQVGQGYKVQVQQAEVPRFYTSIKEAIELNDTVREAATAAGVGAKHLTRRISQLKLGIKYKKLDPKPTQAAANKAKRMQIARELADVEMEVLLSTFFMDGKKFYVTADGIRAWVPSDADTVYEDPRRVGSKRPIVLYWYICVNAVFGLVFFDFVTGTTDLQRLVLKDAPKSGYKVITHKHPLHACTVLHPTLYMVISKYQPGQHVGSMMAHLPGYAVHHATAVRTTSRHVCSASASASKA